MNHHVGHGNQPLAKPSTQHYSQPLAKPSTNHHTLGKYRPSPSHSSSILPVVFVPSVTSGYYAVSNDNWFNGSIPSVVEVDDDDDDDDDKLNVITTVYVGGMTVIGLYILYRLLKK